MMPRHFLAAGYTLPEMALVLLLNSLVFLGASRMLTSFSLYQAGFRQRQLLHQETDSLLISLEKAVRRAGYCYGDHCQGRGLEIMDEGKCLLLRWDENHNGRWEGPEQADSEYFAYRYARQSLQIRRGAIHCQENQWERLTDPDQLIIEDFHVSTQGQSVIIRLRARSGKYSLQRRHWVVRRNL